LVSTPTSAPTLINDVNGLAALCDELVGEEFYAVDTEFHTERTYFPKLALIQLGWADTVALVDPLGVDPTPLGRVFDGPGTAVAHAAGQDIDVLRAACGVAPSVVFDTQIAAGFLGMSTPSLSRLVEQVLGVTLPKTDQLSDWLQRPIPTSQLAYAAGDVLHLLDLRSAMVAQLEERGRLAWAVEECALAVGGQRRTVVPDEAWWKVGDVRRLNGRSRGVAQEVAAWRERRAAELDRPRRSVLSDLAILTIAQRPPRHRQELEKLRGVDARHLAKGAGAEILGRRTRPRADLRRAEAPARRWRLESVPGRRGGVHRPRSPDRRRAAVRPGPAGHPGRHQPAGDRGAESTRPGLARLDRRRSPATAAGR